MPITQTRHRTEARIQSLGRDMMSRARGAEPSVFSFKWWTDQGMALSTKDARAQSLMFRFINVLPALKTHEQVADYLQQFLGDRDVKLPLPLRMGLSYGSPRSPLAMLVAALARMSAPILASGFICGSTSEEAIRHVLDLRRRRMAFTMDILGEASTTRALAEGYARRYVELVESLAPSLQGQPAVDQVDAGTEGPLPRVNVSVKLSALCTRFDLLNPERSVGVLCERVRPILRRARDLGAFINFDMEQYACLDICTRVVKALLSEPEFKDWPDAGTVVQAYLTDAEDIALDLIDWTRRRGTPITIRLVKGAYWDSETAHAIRQRRRIPVWTHKWESDACFERVTGMLLSHPEWIRTALASHNVRSICAGIAATECLGLDARDLEIQMLSGMGDPLKTAISEMGYRLRIYCPYGELVPGMAYLIRRLLENTSNDSFLRQGFVEGRDEEDLLRSPDQVGLSGEAAPLPSILAQNYFDDEECDMPPFENVADTDFSRSENRARFKESLGSVGTQLGQEYPALIGGKEVSTGDWFNSVNPSRPIEIVGRVSRCGSGEADRAVQAANRAFPDWSTTPVEERAACVRRIGELLAERRFELAAWICLEVAKGWIEADADLSEAIDYCNYYAREMERISSRPGLRCLPGEANLHAYAARGVVAAVGTWSFPLALMTGTVAAAVVAGNTVVMKPASPAGVISAKLMQIIQEAGIPPGVVNYCPGAGSSIGQALVRHPGVALVAFTGSREIGCQLYSEAAKVRPGQRHLKQVIASFGGKNAVIVDLDAELDQAVTGIRTSTFGYSGQKCTACSRAIVLDDVYEAFVERLVESAANMNIGPADDPGTVITPVIDAAARDSIMRYVEWGSHNSRCLLRGDVSAQAESNGYYVPPVIFGDVSPDAGIAQEEIFGPVLCVIRARDFSDALRIANGTEYALVGGVYSRSPRNLERARREFAVGNLYVNRPCSGSVVDRQPFGGFGMSGLTAQAGGTDYLIQYLQARTISENTMRHGMAAEAEATSTPAFVHSS